MVIYHIDYVLFVFSTKCNAILCTIKFKEVKNMYKHYIHQLYILLHNLCNISIYVIKLPTSNKNK